MKINNLVYLVTGCLILSGCMAGNSLIKNGVSSNKSFLALPTIAQASEGAKSLRPQTKTAIISVEGEKTQVTLKLYQQSSPRFSTYFPQNYFIPQSSSSGEGTGVRFYVSNQGIKNPNAYVYFFFPSGRTNLAQLRNWVTGKRGLISSNGWQIVSRTQKVPYSWVQEKINFQQRKGNEIILGSVYLGEYKGKAFYVVSQCPGDYVDGFEPRASLIFQNLQLGG